jgi:hypothetical protein
MRSDIYLNWGKSSRLRQMYHYMYLYEIHSSQTSGFATIHGCGGGPVEHGQQSQQLLRGRTDTAYKFSNHKPKR